MLSWMTRFRKRSERITFYVVGIVVLLGVNYWLAHRATQVQRVRVSYTPVFLAQVRAGNVTEITSRGTAIQGDFRHPVASGGTTKFSTEIPAFADTNQLSILLQKQNVAVNAVPLSTGASWWQSLIYGFGPAILFLLIVFWFLRRSRSGMLGGFGR